MTPEAAIHIALITRAESLAFTKVYPSKGEEQPAGQYVEIRHLPNITERNHLKASAPIERTGILQVTLCDVLGQYESVYVERAGQIALHFGRGSLPAVDGVTVHIVKSSISQGFTDGQHWRVPVSVYYRTHA